MNYMTQVFISMIAFRTRHVDNRSLFMLV